MVLQAKAASSTGSASAAPPLASSALSVIDQLEDAWSHEETGTAASVARPSIAAFRRCLAAGGSLPGSGSTAEKLLVELHETTWAHLHGRTAAAASSEDNMGLWREAFSACCLMRTVITLRPEVGSAGSKAMLEALRLADLGLIVGGPETYCSSALFAAAEQLSQVLSSDEKEDLADCQPARKKHCPCTEGKDVANPLARPAKVSQLELRRPVREVPRGQSLGLESFLIHHFSVGSPVVIRGGCDAWPAVRRWADLAFWCEGGVSRRFVPVEMDYWLDEGFQLMSIRDFVKHCTKTESLACPPPGLSGGGYMAQHAMLDQIPSLAGDVLTPDLAMCGSEGSLLRQMFFGPKGTVTPLHHDPYENIFCQVVGSKYLRLFAPSETDRLYPRRQEELMQNNSTVEPPDILEGEEAGDYTSRFPKLLEANFVEVVMEPGDMLYLPKGWWHFVKSLSTSISVAFHFN